MTAIYPLHYPIEKGFNPYSPPDWAFSWTLPLESDSKKLAEQVRDSGQTIRYEGGLCHSVFSCYEAAHRLEKSVAILLSSDSKEEKLMQLSKLHLQ